MEKLIFEHHTMVKQRWVFARADAASYAKRKMMAGPWLELGSGPGKKL
jgi:hypothetical protein